MFTTVLITSAFADTVSVNCCNFKGKMFHNVPNISVNDKSYYR